MESDDQASDDALRYLVTVGERVEPHPHPGGVVMAYWLVWELALRLQRRELAGWEGWMR